MCSPSAGHGVHARRRRRRRRRRQQRRNRPGRRADLGPAPARLRAAGAAHTSCMSFMRALAICASSSRAIDLLGGQRRERLDDDRAQRLARRRARASSTTKRSSVASSGRCEHLLAEGDPLALVLQAQHHRLAVAGGERAVGIDRRVRGAGARRRRRRRRRRSTADSSSTRPCSRASRRRCAQPWPVLPRCDQRRQDAAVGVHAGGDVGDRAAGLRRLVRRAGDRQEARLALDQQVVGLLVAVRARRRRSPRCRRRSGADASRAAPRTTGPGAPRRRARGSAPARRRARAACASDRPAPAACLTSSVRLSFERLVQTKCEAMPLHALVVGAREVAARRAARP